MSQEYCGNLQLKNPAVCKQVDGKEKQLHCLGNESRMLILIFPVNSYTFYGGVLEFDYKWKYWEASRG